MNKLIKRSSPGWEKEFSTKEDLIQELRNHICGACLVTGEDYEQDGETYTLYYPVDVTYDGVEYLCKHLPTLLSTPCGHEYEAITDEDE